MHLFQCLEYNPSSTQRCATQISTADFRVYFLPNLHHHHGYLDQLTYQPNFLTSDGFGFAVHSYKEFRCLSFFLHISVFHRATVGTLIEGQEGGQCKQFHSSILLLHHSSVMCNVIIC